MQGVIKGGGVQWMTAGRGVVHSEMPKITDGDLWGFQLWINLPAKDKMIKPRYQDYQAEDIPTVTGNDGCSVRVMAGEVHGQKGEQSLSSAVCRSCCCCCSCCDRSSEMLRRPMALCDGLQLHAKLGWQCPGSGCSNAGAILRSVCNW